MRKREKGWGEKERETEGGRERENTEYGNLFSKSIVPFEGV